VTEKFSLIQKIGAAAVGVIFFAGSIISIMLMNIEKRKKFFLFFIIIGFFLPLSWYSITSPHRRYLLPVTAVFIVPLAVGIYHLSEKLLTKISAAFPKINPGENRGLVTIVLTASLFIFSAAYASVKNIPSPRQTYRLEDGYIELGEYLSKHLEKDKTFLRRGKHNYSMEIHYPELERRRSSYNIINTLDEFHTAFTKNEKIQFIVLNSETYHFCRKALAGYVDKDRTDKYIFSNDREGLIFRKPIPDWEVVMMDMVKPVDYILFKKASK
jgi:hypothetical protein